MIRKQHLANVKRSAHMSLRERNRVWIFQRFLGRVLDSTLSWICHEFDIFDLTLENTHGVLVVQGNQVFLHVIHSLN